MTEDKYPTAFLLAENIPLLKPEDKACYILIVCMADKKLLCLHERLPNEF